jgi:glutamyl-tRNA reductase
LERAELLAASVGGRPRGWQDLDASLIEADIVISSTASPTPVITKKQLKALRRKRRGRSLFLIDIAVPRDVEPDVNDLENVYLYDIDDLSHVVAQSLEGRAGEANKAEDMVEREAKIYEERRSQLAMKPLIVALRERTREVLHGELGRTTRSRLKHLSEEDLDALAKMLEAAANKLLHAPTTRLKQIATTPQSEDVAQLMCHLFELDAALVKPLPEAAASEAGAGQAESGDEDEAVSERRPIAVR